MKKEDLKVGMTILHNNEMARIITALGETKYLFYYNTRSVSNPESFGHYSALTMWNPKPDPPELYWQWRLCMDGINWLRGLNYLSETGKFMNGQPYGSTWSDVGKHKIPGTAITSDGKSWEGPE